MERVINIEDLATPKSDKISSGSKFATFSYPLCGLSCRFCGYRILTFRLVFKAIVREAEASHCFLWVTPSCIIECREG